MMYLMVPTRDDVGEPRATSNTQQAAKSLVDYVEAPWLYADGLIQGFIDHLEEKARKEKGGAGQDE